MNEDDGKIMWLHNHVPMYLHQTIDSWPCGCLAIRMIARPFADILANIVKMCPEHQAMYDKSHSP